MKRLLRNFILLLVRLFGILGAYRAARQAKRPLSATPRILLIRPDHLGDVVLTTPVLHALRTHAPKAQITMIVGPWSSAIVAHHPAIDRLITCPFPGFQRAAQKPLAPYIQLLQAAQQLQRGNYDLAINLRPDFWWGAALLYLARIPRRVGYALAPSTSFLTHALPFQSPELATISSLRLISVGLETLGYSPFDEPYTPGQYPLQFSPTTEEQGWVTERLSQAGIDGQTPFVVIHPGTGAAVKLWRPEAWADCANRLPDVLPLRPTLAPLQVILTGSKGEQPLLEEIAKGITIPPLVMTNMTVGQLAALLGRARMVLAVDNGPAHIAVAQGTPTVQIFGPTDPHIFGPWGKAEQHTVVASTKRCPTCPMIPCGRLDFSPEEVAMHPCVRLVTEQTLLAAIKRLGTIEQEPGPKSTTPTKGTAP